MDEPDPPPIDPALDALARKLFVLANANRLALLEALRLPRSLSEIRLPAQGPGARAGAAMARQSVREHLDRLEEAGLLRRESAREGRGDEWSVDASRLYALAEEFRRLAIAPAPHERFATETLAVPDVPARRLAAGPRLLVVHGLEEGRAFELGAANRGRNRGWIVGRKPGLAVTLDYDPFVSSEHAEIEPRAGGFVAIDVRSSTNGTFVNWERLPRGGEATLAHGDVLGVGRTLLLFRDR